VSLHPCAHLGRKLADASTCGARCQAFPDCLPAMSPELALRVAHELDATASDHQAVEAVHGILGQLHAAILEGLNRKEPS
jgi:hypothetical protein